MQGTYFLVTLPGYLAQRTYVSWAQSYDKAHELGLWGGGGGN